MLVARETISFMTPKRPSGTERNITMKTDTTDAREETERFVSGDDVRVVPGSSGRGDVSEDS